MKIRSGMKLMFDEPTHLRIIFAVTDTDVLRQTIAKDWRDRRYPAEKHDRRFAEAKYTPRPDIKQ